MSCYHPYVYVNRFDLSNPQELRLYNSLKALHQGDSRFSKYVHGTFVPRELAIREGLDLEKHHALLVPCGRCIGCRLDYSRQWAERCIHEAKEHEFNYFLTLTYDDDHLTIGDKGFATLIQDEISAFMKRLRKAMKKELGVDNIRFFACGEYGDGNGDSPDIHVMFRPHYHILLFNCPLPDLQERHPIKVDGKIKMIRQYDSNGELLMFSPLVHRAWQERGTAQIGKVTYESAAYVARYVVKKLYGKDGVAYSDQGVIPPFVRMSRMPGIGFNWYMTNMKHIYDFDSVTFKRGDKVITQKPGKYCDKLLRSKNEDVFHTIKYMRHQDFYDGLDCKTFEAVDVVLNNRKAERLKMQSAKLLKRSI